MERPRPQLLDDRGIPYVPAEYFDFPGELTTHHLYYPRRAYLGRTAVHSAFRQLNTVEIPWEGHRQFHHDFLPPEMPDYYFMLDFVHGVASHVSRRLQNEINQTNKGVANG